MRYLTFGVLRLLDAELEFGDGVEALPEMWLYGERVPGLSQDLEQLIIGQEVESGTMKNLSHIQLKFKIVEQDFNSTALNNTLLKFNRKLQKTKFIKFQQAVLILFSLRRGFTLKFVFIIITHTSKSEKLQ